VAALPLVHVGEPLPQLVQLALDVHLLALRADALQRPLVAALAQPQHQVVRVVLLEGRTCRDGDQGWFG